MYQFQFINKSNFYFYLATILQGRTNLQNQSPTETVGCDAIGYTDDITVWSAGKFTEDCIRNDAKLY